MPPGGLNHGVFNLSLHIFSRRLKNASESDLGTAENTVLGEMWWDFEALLEWRPNLKIRIC